MTIHVHARVHAVCLAALLGFVTFGLPADTFAQASTDKVHVARRLGGASRFTPAVRTIPNLQKTFARPRTQNDITAVLKLAELSPEAQAGIVGLTANTAKARTQLLEKLTAEALLSVEAAGKQITKEKLLGDILFNFNDTS